jgi:hypothetical protein
MTDNELHDIHWALERFTYGATIRRKAWHKGVFFGYARSNQQICPEDVFAVDWELA